IEERKKTEQAPDLIIANGENAAHGFGLTEKIVTEFVAMGIDIISGGNHTFDRKDIFDFIDRYPFVLRPANYPQGTPGTGLFIASVNGFRIAVLSLLGRVFMEPLDSPFLIADRIISQIEADAIIVDFHAEATAEKVALGWYLDGRVAAVVGTHTHVQTADERILPGGCAYITDAGCCGPRDGVIGMDRQMVLRRLVEQLPTRLELASGIAMLNGVSLLIDASSGKATGIERERFIEKSEFDKRQDTSDED
ncbi:MAG: TIGR00282 family metallophosphoesterase, partial [Candidatus Obscuribacterales bacterium]|nr:TIGR00282 family metallophosphoesterase [Candidatus Obscuribacterales bacterium]